VFTKNIACLHVRPARRPPAPTPHPC
jgi:hypothetical protein